MELQQIKQELKEFIKEQIEGIDAEIDELPAGYQQDNEDDFLAMLEEANTGKGFLNNLLEFIEKQ